MLHRLKLRLLYADALHQDKHGHKERIRTTLLAGFLVYPPFLAIAYFIAFETKAVNIVIIGLLAALTSIPVVFYGYAKGMGSPFLPLFRERREELLWLALKIGFFYPFFLYFMILGIVEFTMGYGVVRAAMISFVASAVARDGFEIGFYRKRSEKETITTFPDGKLILPYLKSLPQKSLLIVAGFISISYGIGWFLGPYIKSHASQTVLAGVVAGIMATMIYARTIGVFTLKSLGQFFLWPGFTMAVSYFFGLTYIFKMILTVPLTPSAELAFLMAISSAWLILEVQFVGYLKTCMPVALFKRKQSMV
jgi:hypothetical protein